MNDARLQQGIDAVKAGRKAEGRALLGQVVQANPRSELGWLWLSAVVDTDKQQRFCLLQVLATNRRNAVAAKGLEKLGPGDAQSPFQDQALSCSTQPEIDFNRGTTCPNCRAWNPIMNRFCDQCATPLVSSGGVVSQPAAATKPSRPTTITPSTRTAGRIGPDTSARGGYQPRDRSKEITKPLRAVSQERKQSTASDNGSKRTKQGKQTRRLASLRSCLIVAVCLGVLGVLGYFLLEGCTSTSCIIGKWQYNYGGGRTEELEFFRDGTFVLDGYVLGVKMKRTGNYRFIDDTHIRADAAGLFGGSGVSEFYCYGDRLVINGHEFTRIR